MLWIATEGGEIGEDDSSFGDGDAFVNVRFGGGMGDAEAGDGGPAVDFLDEGPDVGKRLFVAPVGEAGGAHDEIELWRSLWF